MAGRHNRRHVDFRTIQTELVRSRTYYADPDFPPEPWSLFINGRIPANLRYRIVWKRPKDLCKNPKFIVDGARRHDLDQGLLGNCWFIAGAASLAIGHKNLFEKVVPPDQTFESNYAGIFRFNFWWYGKWVEVVVDDNLPTQNGVSLIYCQNRTRTEPEEFWPCLLEKAYAKLRGCYEALDGGKLQDSLVDLTGGVSETIDLRDKAAVPRNLYDLLSRCFEMKTLQGCSIFRPEGSPLTEIEMPNGLYMGHAYSITGYKQLLMNRNPVQLLRIRNPWGEKEWNGAWSDRSREMMYLPQNIKEEMGVSNKDEGEFWISYPDFLQNFHEVQLCHLQMDAMMEAMDNNTKQQNWNVMVYHDEWIRGVTAGGCGNTPNERLYWKNPQFHIELKKPDTINNQEGLCTVIISLMEKELDKKVMVAIGFDVYKLKQPDLRPLNDRRAPQNALVMAKRNELYVHYREITRRFELAPGHYVIIPSTFFPHEEAKFMLRIFTENYAESRVMEEKEEEPTVMSPKDYISDLFYKFCGSDNRLDAVELQQFLAAVSEGDIRHRFNFSIEQCRSLLPMMDESQTGRLGFEEAKKLWKEIKAYREVFLQFDKDRTSSVDTFELTNMFTKLDLKSYLHQQPGTGGAFPANFKVQEDFFHCFFGVQQGPEQMEWSWSQLEFVIHVTYNWTGIVGSIERRCFPVSRAVLTSIVRRYGDRQNRISLEDFIVVIIRLIQLFNVFRQQETNNGHTGVAEFSRNEFLQHTMYL